MKALLLRGLEEELLNKIKKKAEKESLSMNKYIILLLEENFGFAEQHKKGIVKYNDLKNLFGKWSSKEYRDISKSVKKQRIIDCELWK
jgi:hypothetical protein